MLLNAASIWLASSSRAPASSAITSSSPPARGRDGRVQFSQLRVFLRGQRALLERAQQRVAARGLRGQWRLHLGDARKALLLAVREEYRIKGVVRVQRIALHVAERVEILEQVHHIVGFHRPALVDE